MNRTKNTTSSRLLCVDRMTRVSSVAVSRSLCCLARLVFFKVDSNVFRYYIMHIGSPIVSTTIVRHAYAEFFLYFGNLEDPERYETLLIPVQFWFNIPTILGVGVKVCVESMIIFFIIYLPTDKQLSAQLTPFWRRFRFQVTRTNSGRMKLI